MSNEEQSVNLAELTERFKELALDLNWCFEAEERFEAATGVTPREPERVLEPCPAVCGRDHFRILQETRFRLPDGAPETVPVAPIVAALKAYAERLIDYCDYCDYCDEVNRKEREALQSLANTLPGKPDISA